MREELRRSNTIGDSKGIIYFAGVVLKNGEIKKDSARQICSFKNDVRINFNSAVAFFEYLGFIDVTLSTIAPTDEGKRLYSHVEGGFDESFCEACLSKVTADATVDLTAIRFDTTNGKYYIQKHGFPMAAAVFRNVLIQLSALTQRPDGALELCEQYEHLFAKVQRDARKTMSLESLKLQLERQEIQGEEAELFVLRYECNRLENSPNVHRVKRISEIDVSAGYDIVSFEDSSALDYNRFIEVKSFIEHPHFYWSKNEIDKASLLGDEYFIYLIDADKQNHDAYVPAIIRNPAKMILESDEWLMQPTSYLVLPTGG